MEVGKALKQLDQIRRERQALGQFYDELLVRADRSAREDEATERARQRPIPGSTEAPC